MNYMNIGKSGISASVISLGTWGLGGGTSWRDTDDHISINIIHSAREFGINLIDTAPVYGTGHSEELVGMAIKGKRSSYIISTKCSMHWRNTQGIKMYERDGQRVYKNFSKESLRADLEESLKRLNTDYIDIYFTHRQPDSMEEIPEVYDALNTFKKEGKIRAIGISNASAAYMNEYLKCGSIDIVQEKFSILERKPLEEYIPLCENVNITFQGFSVLERGLLTGKIGMDYAAEKGEARATIKWFEESKRILVVDMLHGWRDLCNKYNCSMTNLIIAYTLKCSSSFNALFGVRKMENLVDAVKAVEIGLDDCDVKKMEKDSIRTLELSMKI